MTQIISRQPDPHAYAGTFASVSATHAAALEALGFERDPYADTALADGLTQLHPVHHPALQQALGALTPGEQVVLTHPLLLHHGMYTVMTRAEPQDIVPGGVPRHASTRALPVVLTVTREDRASTITTGPRARLAGLGPLCTALRRAGMTLGGPWGFAGQALARQEQLALDGTPPAAVALAWALDAHPEAPFTALQHGTPDQLRAALGELETLTPPDDDGTHRALLWTLLRARWRGALKISLRH